MHDSHPDYPTKESPWPVAATTERLTGLITERGMTIFATIDQRAAARRAGLELRETVLIIFGQNKHHRWSLDEGQIFQYHLGGALHPQVRWWEAMDVPRMALQFVQVGEELTIVSLVCEDLAQNDDVAKVIRAVGPNRLHGIVGRPATQIAVGRPVRERPSR